MGVSNTSAPQVRRPAPGSRAAPPRGQKEVSRGGGVVELKVIHDTQTQKGFPGNSAQRREQDVSLGRLGSGAAKKAGSVLF